MEKLKFWKLGLAVLIMAVALAGCGGGGGGGAAAPAPTPLVFAPPNTLAGITGGTFGIAVAVNNGATTVMAVGQADNAGLDTMGVRWDIDALTGAPVAPVTLAPINVAGTFSAAYAINDAGVAVGESDDGGAIVATSWSADAVPVITALPTAAGILSPTAAYGINAAGQIVGEAMVGGTPHAVLWNDTATAPIDLGLLAGGTASAAYAISDNGFVVGEADDANGIWAVAWLVSADGLTVTGPALIGSLTGHVASLALGVNAAGLVVGESEDALGVIHAAQWSIDGNLAVTGSVDQGADGSASDVNDVQRIAGQLGTPSAAKVWQVGFPTFPDNVIAPVVPAVASQAFSINNANLVVGASGSNGFVAIPQ